MSTRDTFNLLKADMGEASIAERCSNEDEISRD